MGTWGTSISSNDDYMDIHDELMEDYNKGISILTLVDDILEKYEKQFTDDESSLYNLYFAVAYAEWECGIANSETFAKVKDIVEGGRDIECWKALGASKSDLGKREKVLAAFLEKISIPKTKIRKPKPTKFKPAVFEKGDVLSVYLENGTYSGAIVLDNVKMSEEFGSNFIVKAFIQKSQQVTMSDILNAKIYDYCWYIGVNYKKYIARIGVIGKIEIENNYSWSGPGTSHSSWGNFVAGYDNDDYCLKENNDIKT